MTKKWLMKNNVFCMSDEFAIETTAMTSISILIYNSATMSLSLVGILWEGLQAKED